MKLDILSAIGLYIYIRDLFLKISGYNNILGFVYIRRVGGGGLHIILWYFFLFLIKTC